MTDTAAIGDAAERGGGKRRAGTQYLESFGGSAPMPDVRRAQPTQIKAVGMRHPTALLTSPIHAAPPSGVGCVQPPDEDGLLFFTGRWLSSRPAKPSAQVIHREGDRPQRFSDEVCVWLPGNTHEEIFDIYNGIG